MTFERAPECYGERGGFAQMTSASGSQTETARAVFRCHHRQSRALEFVDPLSLPLGLTPDSRGLWSVA